MKKLLLLGFVVLILLVSACSSAAPTNPTDTQGASSTNTLDGKTIVEQRCTACHNLSRVTSASKTADEWKASVELMVGKGAKLTAQEQQVVIDYLAATYSK